MRDDRIYKMNQQRAVSEVLLYKQLQFLNTRLEAFETVLVKRWAILKAIFNPLALLQAVNEKQMELMRQHDESMREAAEKRKEEAMKPKITIVGANGMKAMLVILMISTMTGCVSMKAHKLALAQAEKDGYSKANVECLALQAKIGAYIETLKERLNRFNQINEDGSLRTKKNDDSKPFDSSEETNDGR